jgi:hypothetical protein
MSLEPSSQSNPLPMWADGLDEQKDKVEEAAREEQEASEHGRAQADEDADEQARLNP